MQATLINIFFTFSIFQSQAASVNFLLLKVSLSCCFSLFYSRNVECLGLLMRYGADATALDKLGRYCIHNYDMFCSMPFIVPTTIINFVLILRVSV